MASIPSSVNKQVGFRSPTSSSEHNAHTEEIFNDIMGLYDVANKLENELASSNQAFELTGRFQHLHAQKLEHRIVQLEEELQKAKSGEALKTAYLFTEHMTEDLTSPQYERAYIDATHEVLHIPITGKSISKVYIYDEVAKEIHVPDALHVDVFPVTKNGWRIEENSPVHAFNGDNNSYWHRKVIMPLEDAPQKDVTAELIVTLPDTIISNRDVNTIYIKTFPVHSLQIDKVEYRLEGDWVLVPGWEVDADNNPAPQSYAGNIKLCFPNIAMSQVRVSMTQYNWFEEDHKKVYHFGLQEVGIFYTDYQSDTGRFDVPIILQGGTGTNLIRSLKPIFRNATALSDKSDTKSSVFSYNIYTVDEFGQTHYTKDTFPIVVTSDQLIVRAAVHMDPYNKVTPVLERIELTYENV
jgi:hypothetical protein